MKSACILVIRSDGDGGSAPGFKDTLQSLLEGRYEVGEVVLRGSLGEDRGEALSLAIRRDKPRVLILCPSGDRAVAEVSSLLELGRRGSWQAPVMVVLQGRHPAELLEVVKLGISDFITLPLRKVEVLARLWALDRRVAEEDPVFSQLYAKHGIGQIVGRSPAFLAAVRELPKIAKCNASVLVNGETGTGKEIVARAIHYLSSRSGKPFVPVNCGAVPVELLENEFFGHESGAFTSANSVRHGVVQEAEGGTLFLDEIDCLPLPAQVKFLRFLQDGHYRPLGSERVCQGDVRVIAASNTDFKEALKSNRFRKDLYYRLNVLSVSLPPLRERPEDIGLLARHFLLKYAEKFAASVRDFAPATLLKLACYDWPGNVRELENVVERAVVLAEHALIQPGDVRLHEASGATTRVSFQQLKAMAINQFERTYLRQALSEHGGNISKAAESAQKDRRAFWELLRKHHITAEA